MRTRITVDLDTWDALALLRTFYNMRYALGHVDEVRQTDKGYHLIARGVEVSGPEQRDAVRLVLGDDLARIALDNEHAGIPFKPTQILWTRKHGGPRRWRIRERGAEP